MQTLPATSNSVKNTSHAILSLLLLYFFSTTTHAQTEKKAKAFDKTQIIAPSVSQHTVTIGGEKIKYTATAGYITVNSEVGEDQAYIFYTAYTRDDISTNKAKRPVTFTFNGGPGASSAWLHLGTMGPYRIDLADDAAASPPPYKFVENQYSWLDATDLVFIDPVSTGFSRAKDEDFAKEYYSYSSDIRSLADVIRRYLTLNNRWSSPKYLAGESYGTARVAGLSNYLSGQFGIYLNGVIMVSSILNFQTTYFNDGNDLPYCMYLPSYTAAAYYHKRLAPELQRRPLPELLNEVEEFAMKDYNVALMRGDAVSEADRQRILGKLSMYTGLSTTYIERANLRIWIQGFRKELLRDQYQVVGRFDSRIKLVDLDANDDISDIDPSYAMAQGAFTSCMNEYFQTVLNFKSALNYEILTSKVRPWDYNEKQNRYLNASEDLRQAMFQNPHMDVWVACGYYDLATPYFAAEYTINHMGLDKEQRSSIRMTYYEAGHMMYLHRNSLVRLKEDAKSFFSMHAAAK